MGDREGSCWERGWGAPPGRSVLHSPQCQKTPSRRTFGVNTEKTWGTVIITIFPKKSHSQLVTKIRQASSGLGCCRECMWSGGFSPLALPSLPSLLSPSFPSLLPSLLPSDLFPDHLSAPPSFQILLTVDLTHIEQSKVLGTLREEERTKSSRIAQQREVLNQTARQVEKALGGEG